MMNYQIHDPDLLDEWAREKLEEWRDKLANDPNLSNPQKMELEKNISYLRSMAARITGKPFHDY